MLMKHVSSFFPWHCLVQALDFCKHRDCCDCSSCYINKVKINQTSFPGFQTMHRNFNLKMKHWTQQIWKWSIFKLDRNFWTFCTPKFALRFVTVWNCCFTFLHKKTQIVSVPVGAQTKLQPCAWDPWKRSTSLSEPFWREKHRHNIRRVIPMQRLIREARDLMPLTLSSSGITSLVTKTGTQNGYWNAHDSMPVDWKTNSPIIKV